MRLDFEAVNTGRSLFKQIHLAFRAGGNVMLHGDAGVGKTEHFLAYCDEHSIAHLVLNLAMRDAVDMAGLPYILDGRTRNAIPSFFPTTEESSEGILVFEELTRASPETLAPVYDFITSRRLGDYRLPDGWRFGACVNDAGADYHAYTLDRAMLDRFQHFIVSPDRDSWLEYATRHELHPAIIEYVRDTPAVFQSEPSPRAWTYASRALIAAENEPDTSENDIRTALSGWLGAQVASKLTLAMRAGRVGLRGADILDSYPSYREEVKLWVKSGRAELVGSSIESLERAFRSIGPTSEESPARRHALMFFGDLTGDMKDRCKAVINAHLLASRT